MCDTPIGTTWWFTGQDRNGLKKLMNLGGRGGIGTNNPNVCWEKIFPPLLTKLGHMKEFVISLNTECECMVHRALLFENIKVGVFDGPQICTLVRDKNFVRKMDGKKRRVWFSSVTVIENFLGNKKANYYENLVTNLFSAFHEQVCKTRVKLHFLFSFLINFLTTWGSKWRVSKAVPSRPQENMGTLSREIGQTYEGRLLLEH